jgi:hypothetical protein
LPIGFFLRFRVGVQPTQAGKRLDAGKFDLRAAFGADAAAEQLVAPFNVTQGYAFAGDGRRSAGILPAFIVVFFLFEHAGILHGIILPF